MAETDKTKRRRNGFLFAMAIGSSLLCMVLMFWWFVLVKAPPPMPRMNNYYWTDAKTDSTGEHMVILGFNDTKRDSVCALLVTTVGGKYWQLLPIAGNVIYDRMDLRWKGNTLQTFLCNDNIYKRLDFERIGSVSEGEMVTRMVALPKPIFGITARRVESELEYSRYGRWWGPFKLDFDSNRIYAFHGDSRTRVASAVVNEGEGEFVFKSIPGKSRFTNNGPIIFGSVSKYGNKDSIQELFAYNKSPLPWMKKYPQVVGNGSWNTINSSSATWWFSERGRDLHLLVNQSRLFVPRKASMPTTLLIDWPRHGTLRAYVDSGGISHLGYLKLTGNQAKTFSYSPKLAYDLEDWLLWRKFLFANLVICIGLWILYYWRSKADKIALEAKLNDDDVLIIKSDKPVSEDKLKLYEAELNTLSDIINDSRNEGPIRFIIDAEWGQGKSSLMLMLKARLENENPKVITYWHNLWHYENETDMLAAFIASVRQAVQAQVNRDTMMWLRLIGIQVLKSPVTRQLPYFLLLTIGGPVLAYLLFHTLSEVKNFYSWAWIPSATDWKWYQGLHNVLSKISLSQLVQAGNIPETAGLFGTLIGVLLGIKNFMTKTRFNGFWSLFISDGMNKMQADLADNTQELFKREFWDLMEDVGSKRTLVVFIDDADRVDGQKIKEILQTVNFMVDVASRPDSSFYWLGRTWHWRPTDRYPRIYFVMGMWMKKVAENLGRTLLMAEKGSLDGKTEIDFQAEGMKYLEKIADMVLPVPGFGGVNPADLMASDITEGQKEEESNTGNSPDQTQTEPA